MTILGLMLMCHKVTHKNLKDRTASIPYLQTTSLVDMGITPHIPTQNRTCAINAYGFSLYILYSIYKTNSL